MNAFPVPALVGVVLFSALCLLCLARGLFKLRRARELEYEARFRAVAHQVRFVGWFLLLCSASFLVAALYVIQHSI